jgi:alpha-amylase/alpha-mannosidase (GH57 family)
MPDDRLHVAFLWHMHQPYYREVDTGRCQMPWTRLHATKDYLFLPALLREYPGLKATFNLVPSLLKQVQLYGRGASDDALDLSRKPAAELTHADKIALLHSFFMANPEHMIQPYPEYADLWTRRGGSLKDEDLESRLPLFSTGDFLDLQTWYNLTWTDPLLRAQVPELLGLVQKGKGFTEAEKALVLDVHDRSLRRVIPLYRELQEQGQIELTTTPFYHPILPLLCDTESAREALMHLQLPERFVHPEDAREQVRRAREFHAECFGAAPAGMWPSEGSVSPQALQLIAEAGLKWVATDEEILAESLGRYGRTAWNKTEHLYRPYRAELANGASLQMVFRDHELSDQIGFTYMHWDPKEAAADLLKRLRAVRAAQADRPGPHLAVIALDGENAWEYYPGNGEEFLRRLYEGLAQSQDLVTVRLGEFLSEHPAEQALPQVFSGSWINHNFAIWIGHPEDNASWNYLSRTRQDLVEWEREHGDDPHREARALAWEALYVAEGSDWNWWYGDDHSSSMDMEFDQLYRAQLSAVYRTLGKPVPDYLHVPIRQHRFLPGTVVQPTALLTPSLDGSVSDYFEWLAAGYVDAKGANGAMHQAESAFQGVYFGFDLERLYLRIDLNRQWLETHPLTQHELGIRFLGPQPRLLRIRTLVGGTVLDLYRKDDQDRWVVVQEHGLRSAVKRVIELSIPFTDLEARPGEELRFWLFLRAGEKELERCPRPGPIGTKVPDERFESTHWNA